MIVLGVSLLGPSMIASNPAMSQTQLFIDQPLVVQSDDGTPRQGTPPPDDPTAAGQADEVGQPLTARGLLEADREAVLSAEIAGRILDIPFDVGDTFAEGDTLVQFDCALYQAQLNGAQAALAGAYRTLANNRQLAALNSIGQLDVQLSEAAVVEAQAQVDSSEVITERCTMLAPYGGRVLDRLVNPFESVEAGQQLIAIADDGRPKITVIVPSVWLRWLEPGTGFQFNVDETGETHAATVESLGARIDPVSQTIEITARLGADATGLIIGMSGTATFPNRP